MVTTDMLSGASTVKQGVTAVSIACVVCGLASLAGSEPGSADNAAWVQVSKNDRLAIFARSQAGFAVKEIRAIGSIDAPNWVVKNVIDRVEDYPRFMPYTTKVEVIARKPRQVIGYFRLNPPFIGALDVTVSLSSQSEKHGDGMVSYQIQWETVNALGPAPISGVTRIKLNQGSWNLDPGDGGKKTIATYTILTDGGSALPASALNFANRQWVEALFSAIRKQVGLITYSQNRTAD